MIKVIDSIQYHVWSDALHARELARKTTSDWDRGAYVRWAIQTGWTSFEVVCAEALNAHGLGMRFKERFNEAVASRGLPAVDWGQGVWQRLLQIYQIRKGFTHVVPSISHGDLLASLPAADQAINTLRDGIKSVADLVGRPHPPWISDDSDAGWNGPRNALHFGGAAKYYLVKAGASEADPEAIRIAYIVHGKEHLSEIAPPGTPHGPLIDSLLARLNIGVDAIRAYKGTTLLEERATKMRT